jgi:hypothetical protein
MENKSELYHMRPFFVLVRNFFAFRRACSQSVCMKMDECVSETRAASGRNWRSSGDQPSVSCTGQYNGFGLMLEHPCWRLGDGEHNCHLLHTFLCGFGANKTFSSSQDNVLLFCRALEPIGTGLSLKLLLGAIWKKVTALNKEEKENFYQVRRCYCGGLFGMKLVVCSTRAIRTDWKLSKVGVASKLVKSR